MKNDSDKASHLQTNRGRRNFLKLPLAAGVGGGLAYLGYLSRAEPDR